MATTKTDIREDGYDVPRMMGLKKELVLKALEEYTPENDAERENIEGHIRLLKKGEEVVVHGL